MDAFSKQKLNSLKGSCNEMKKYVSTSPAIIENFHMLVELSFSVTYLCPIVPSNFQFKYSA